MGVDYLPKHSDEILDYPFDWDTVLQVGEAISTVATEIEPVEAGGVVVDSGETTHVANLHSPVCSGGIKGRKYIIRSKITTDQGRTDAQERVVLIR